MGKAETRLIGGRNSVKEALRNKKLRHCFVQEKLQGELLSLVEQIRAEGIPVTTCSPKKLSGMVPGLRHQGIVAELPPFVYADLEEILTTVEQKENSFLVLLDGVEDPHNIGAIIRTADAAGATAVLLPSRRSGAVTETVHKTSAGAAEWLPIVRIGNIAQTLVKLKERGYWVAGADMAGQDLYTEANWQGKIVLVVGNEGKGISRLTKEHCDFLVRIPMRGKVASLNVSVAAALLMYEIAGQQEQQ